MLLRWLQQGGRANTEGVRLTALELYPEEQVLVGISSTQRLVAVGRLSDGTTRDMTGDVRYQVSDSGVVEVSSGGALATRGPGLTSVSARAMGKVATSQIGVVESLAGADYRVPEGNNFIDELVYAKLRQMNVPPAELTSDRAFARRVFLDAIGRLPARQELAEFLDDSSQDKRSQLIDRLLTRPEYASHWRVKFEDWFRNSQLNSQGRSMGVFKDWIKRWLSQDRPYDEVVRALLTSTGDTMVSPAANFWHPATDFMLKEFSLTKMTPTISRLFLGVRLECAECHNHPLENLTQDDFYGFAAFLARLQVKHGYGEYRRTWFLENHGEVEHPLTKKPVLPRVLGGEPQQIPEGVDRRQVLADWLLSPENPYFARATVNRIWAEYFGVGIVEPFDDFRSTNRPINQKLLDRLARFFVDSGFRLSALHRLILNSRTYQAASKKEPSTQLERILAARYLPRPLPAEVLLVSVFHNGYDTHTNNDESHRRIVPEFDQAFSALLEDLDLRGMLETTLVLVIGDFGRTPKINFSGGRDHWPGAFSVALAGAGVNGGQVIGKTDPRAFGPVDRPVTIEDLGATVYKLLGIDAHKTYLVEGRPVAINKEGQPVKEIWT